MKAKPVHVWRRQNLIVVVWTSQNIDRGQRTDGSVPVLVIA
jgi:hypothetical protein